VLRRHEDESSTVARCLVGDGVEKMGLAVAARRLKSDSMRVEKTKRGLRGVCGDGKSAG